MVLKRNLKNNDGNVELAYFDFAQDWILCFSSEDLRSISCYYLHSADERFDATFHTNVLVNASGYCQYIPPGILKSTCYIDVRWFPFDVQKCDLKFGSWTHNGWLLDLQMLDVDTSTYIPNGEWDLVGKRWFHMLNI